MEMYLKALCMLEARASDVRAKDLAAELKLTRPSVTKAIAQLARLGYVDHDPYQKLALTAKGRRIARDVIRRHQVLRAFLHGVLGVSATTADTDACELEHVVSRETLDRLSDFLSFIGQCPRAPLDILRHFQEVAGRRPGPCCGECGLERFAPPVLPEPKTHVAGQHTRF
jgi:DtxR family Mn-dependent transcriptional regulator